MILYKLQVQQKSLTRNFQTDLWDVTCDVLLQSDGQLVDDMKLHLAFRTDKLPPTGSDEFANYIYYLLHEKMQLPPGTSLQWRPT